MNGGRLVAFVVGVIYIATMTGIAIGAAKTVPACTQEPFGYGLAFKILMLTVFPFVVGIIAGHDWED
jgi:uncharacterized membrane protein